METAYKTTVVGLKTYLYVKTMIMLYLTWYRNVEKKREKPPLSIQKGEKFRQELDMHDLITFFGIL